MPFPVPTDDERAARYVALDDRRAGLPLLGASCVGCGMDPAAVHDLGHEPWCLIAYPVPANRCPGCGRNLAITAHADDCPLEHAA